MAPLPTDTTQLDPSIINLMHGLKQQESGGNYNATGDKDEATGTPTAAGVGQWSNQPAGKPVPLSPGEIPANFAADAKKYGLDATDFSPANQNKVMYATLDDWKTNEGLTPEQALSKWNSGDPNMYKSAKSSGTGSVGAYNVAQYVQKAMAYAQSYAKNGSSGTPSPTPTPTPTPSAPMGRQTFSQMFGTPPAPTQTQQADTSSAQGTGSLFPAVTGESPITVGLKTLGNVLPSAFNFAKGVVSSLNPVTIAQNISQIHGLLNDPNVQRGLATESIPGALGSEAYKQLVPAFVQDVIKGDLPAAQRDVTNNPFGSIAPFIFAAEGGAGAADDIASKANMADYVKNIGDNVKDGVPIPKPSTTFSDMINKPMSAVTDTVTAPVKAVGNFLGDNVPALGKYAFGQATGLEPSTIDTRIANPNVDMSTLNRASLGQTVNDALQERIDNVSDAGKGYQSVRNTTTPIDVAPTDLQKIISDNTGLDFKKGQWSANTTSDIRQGADVSKIQKLYDFWQPTFKSGAMTPEQFLNLRSDIGEISKFDNGIGKSAPLDRVGQGMYSDLNTTYRDSVKGLAEKDADYSSQKSDLQRLQKGFIDKNGNLTDGALSKISNSLGKGKDATIARLEEISPGITGKIQQLKMAEDFERAAGNKVGTYGKALGTGLTASVFGGHIMGVAAGLAEAILASPSVADAILRKYGENKPMLQAIAKNLRAGASAVNNLPNSVPQALQGGTVFGRPQPTQ